ncbi:MAG: T9SS type A sorting domain-containing protein [Chitinophagales bacterium]|nr:T9SS type A sorting domain-containing protein [Chitinophagales bacterium]
MKFISTILFCILFILGSSQNTPPIAVNDTATVDEDTPVTIDMLGNDYDAQGPLDVTSLSFTLTPTYGTITSNGGSVITYIPDPNFVGTDYFGYEVCDTGIPVLCDTAIVYINVNPVTDSLPAETCEGCPIDLCIETQFNNPITTTSVISPFSNYGTLSPTMPGCMNYTSNCWGFDTVFIEVCTSNICDTTIFFIQTTTVADTINYTSQMNTTVNFCLDSFTCYSGNNLSSSLLSLAFNGIITQTSPTCYEYVPANNFFGPDTADFELCNNSYNNICDTITIAFDITGVHIIGNISTSLATPLQNSTVLLIGYDSSVDSVGLFAQTTTDTSGFFEFINIYADMYIKAIPDSSHYPNEVPTYYTNSTTFSSAISVPHIIPYSIANFNTIAGVNPGGSGFISGYVSLGAGKKDGGEPVENLNLILKNTNNEVVKHTTTNSLGYFEYDNLAIDEYSVWVDNYTVSNDSTPIVSLLENSLQENLSFTLEEDILILNKATAITSNKNLNVSIYPNPTTGTINIENTASNSFLEIYNILGNLVFTKAINTNSTSVNLLNNGISKGTYIIKLKSDNDIFCTKVVLK